MQWHFLGLGSGRFLKFDAAFFRLGQKCQIKEIDAPEKIWGMRY